jgi:hypothetical protein
MGLAVFEDSLKMHIRGCVRALVARIIEQREACGSRKERDGARLSFLDFVPERVGICRRALCNPATSCLETLAVENGFEPQVPGLKSVRGELDVAEKVYR